MAADNSGESRYRVRNTFIELLLPTDTPRDGGPSTTPAAFAPHNLLTNADAETPKARQRSGKTDPLIFTSHSSMMSIPEIDDVLNDSESRPLTPTSTLEAKQFIKLNDFISSVVPETPAEAPIDKDSMPTRRYYELLGERRRNMQQQAVVREAAQRWYSSEVADQRSRESSESQESRPTDAHDTSPKEPKQGAPVAPPPATGPADKEAKDDMKALLNAALRSKNPRAIKAVLSLAQKSGFSPEEFRQLVEMTSDFCQNLATRENAAATSQVKSAEETPGDVTSEVRPNETPETDVPRGRRRRRRGRKSGSRRSQNTEDFDDDSKTEKQAPEGRYTISAHGTMWKKSKYVPKYREVDFSKAHGRSETIQED